MDPDDAMYLAAIFIGWILLLGTACVWMWWHPPVIEDDEHSMLLDDPGLAQRCAPGSGYGDL